MNTLEPTKGNMPADKPAVLLGDLKTLIDQARLRIASTVIGADLGPQVGASRGCFDSIETDASCI
jgi:CTP:molybdopterin cytidylyltransferase MocA